VLLLLLWMQKVWAHAKAAAAPQPLQTVPHRRWGASLGSAAARKRATNSRRCRGLTSYAPSLTSRWRSCATRRSTSLRCWVACACPANMAGPSARLGQSLLHQAEGGRHVAAQREPRSTAWCCMMLQPPSRRRRDLRLYRTRWPRRSACPPALGIVHDHAPKVGLDFREL